MKTYSVYLSYQTHCGRRYKLNSIAFKNIIANDIIAAGIVAISKAADKIKNNITPIEINMIWVNYN